MEIFPELRTGIRRAASPGSGPVRTAPVSSTQPMVALRAAGLTTYGPPTNLSAACAVAKAQKARSIPERVIKRYSSRIHRQEQGRAGLLLGFRLVLHVKS